MIRDVFIGAIICIPLGVLAQGAEPFSAENVKETTATVEAVDHNARTVVLRDSEDVRTLVVAGPDVRNFEQIETGDRVVARYRQAILAEVKPKGEGIAEPTTAVAKARAAEGQRPAAGVAASIATTVVIESVDRSFDTVTFKRPDGIVRTVAVEDPKATQFIHELKPGDEVQVTYTEATALALKPAQ